MLEIIEIGHKKTLKKEKQNLSLPHMSFLEKLKNRWNVGTINQVLIILLVFALTGTTVFLIKKPILALFGGSWDLAPLWVKTSYYILILPVYNLLLLVYGAIFGQYRFFLDFEKKMLNRWFGKKNKHE